MSGRHQSSVERAARGAVVAGAGVAGLATLFAFAPLAHAEPTPASNQSTSPADNESGSTTADAPSPKIDANYGYQKYRVGVRGKDGSYFPTGTSTVGTKLHVVETKADGTPKRDFVCTTEATTSTDVTDASFCPGDDLDDLLQAAGKRLPASVQEPTPGDPDNVYSAGPGVTVKVTQVSVNPNLVTDPSTSTLGPCTAEDFIFCGKFGEGEDENFTTTSTDLIAVDPGLPPLATNDSATTKEGVPVTITIAPNDTAKAPIKTVSIVADPKHGTAKLVTAEAADPTPSPSPSVSTLALEARRAAGGSRSLASVTSYKAIYTPKAGFVGVDTFRYTIATANGTATATVTVKVTGVAAAPTSASSSADALADTGAHSDGLLGYGAALLAAGGGALALGRQRRRGRHAR